MVAGAGVLAGFYLWLGSDGARAFWPFLLALSAIVGFLTFYFTVPRAMKTNRHGRAAIRGLMCAFLTISSFGGLVVSGKTECLLGALFFGTLTALHARRIIQTLRDG